MKNRPVTITDADRRIAREAVARKRETDLSRIQREIDKINRTKQN